jgi:protocatechuate 3,4-dioxygenase beta subunit
MRAIMLRQVSRALAVMSVPLALSAQSAPQQPSAPPSKLPPRATAPAQNPPRDNQTTATAGTGVIRGRVVEAESGNPLLRAQVRLSGPERLSRVIGTDDQGRYEFRDLAPAAYTVSASKGVYLTLQYGQTRPRESGRPIDVAPGQIVDGVDMALPRGAVIVLRVTDQSGDPMPEAGVELEQFRFVKGQRTLTRFSSAFILFSGTNDLGELRLHGIPPGDYYIKATPPRNAPVVGSGDRQLAYFTTYYPGALSSGDAERMTLAPGQELGIDIRMVAARSVTISGVVRRSDGAPMANPGVSLAQHWGTGSSSRGAATQPDGTFRIQNVMPGTYYIEASSRPGTPDGEFASIPIKVGSEDIVGLSVTMRRYGALQGRIAFDSGTPADVRPNAVPLIAESTFSINRARATARDDWTFEITQLNETRLVRLDSSSSGWYLKSITYGGRDVTDAPFDFSEGGLIQGVLVTLTQKRTEVTGRVIGRDGRPAAAYAVVVFAENRERWVPQSRFVAAGRPNQRGDFSVMGLPPGRYLAAAVEYLENGAEADPDLLGQLRDIAVPITLTEGETRSVQLTLEVR